jgi:hypothetical protein
MAATQNLPDFSGYLMIFVRRVERKIVLYSDLFLVFLINAITSFLMVIEMAPPTPGSL